MKKTLLSLASLAIAGAALAHTGLAHAQVSPEDAI